MTTAYPSSHACPALAWLAKALEEVRAVIEEESPAADVAADFPRASLGAMRRTGLLGLVAPADLGGGGGSLTDMVDATIALGRSDASVAMVFAMHCQQVVTLDRFAAPRLHADVMPAVARGEVYLGSVTTEAGSGGGLLTSASATTRRDGCVRVDRIAPIVTGGTHADAFLITMLAPTATSPAHVALLFAERSQLEIEVRGDWRPLGMRATQSVPMRLVGDVPEEQVLGGGEDFRTIVASTYAPLAHIGWAAAWLGTAAGALARVLRHVRAARGRGGFDAGSELLLTNLASVRGRVDAVHALLRHTVGVFERCDDPAAPSVQMLVNTLKTHAAEECFAAVHDLVQTVGLRHGYLTDSPLGLERAFRDLRSASLNYANERLLLTNGALALRDAEVHLA